MVSHAFSFGTQVPEAETDMETGKALWAAQNCGAVFNHMAVEG